MSTYEYQLTLTKILERAVNVFPDVEIVYRNIFRYTYADLYRRIQKLANVLKKLGVREGVKIATLELNTHRHLELYFAVPCMGAVLHMANPRLSLEEIAYILNHAEDEVLFVNEAFLPIVEAMSDKLKTIKYYVIMSDKKEIPETKLKPVYEYEELIDSASSTYEFPELGENQVATMGYTTGTTGLPKGVYFTHRQNVLHTLSVAAALGCYLKITHYDTILHVVPMYHVHSWGMPYVATMLGMKQVFPGMFDPKIFLELVKNEKVTYTCMVPTVLDMILKHPEVDNYKPHLEGLNVIIGGAALPRALCERGRSYGMNVLAAYGLSETCPVLTIAYLKRSMVEWSREEKIEKWVKTGLPIPLVDLRIVDSQGNDVKKDEKQMGEIVVRAPWLTKEYYKDPEKTKELWAGGWMHTGDIAVLDKDGYVKIVDRAKDVVKSGGEWISSLTLEDVILTHPAVSEVAVVGVEHERWGERPIALIVLKPEYKDKVSEDDFKEHLKKFPEKIPRWWMPDRFIFVESIPKTSVGKIDKKVLRQKYKGFLK
ncbi:MAG: long-chain fatty acid--CoA ligase [Candidatus Bathyarchaeota archaeon]